MSNWHVVNVKLMHLIMLYAIVPIALLLVLADQAVFNMSVLLASPFRPETWIIWIYIFGMPHVIGGMKMFADTEYLKFYGWRLARILGVCLLLPPVVIELFGHQYLFLIFMMFIVYHTVAQQFGLTLVALKKAPDTLFYLWKWSSVGVGALIYVMLYGQPLPIALVDNGLKTPFMVVGGGLFLVGLFAASVLMWRNRANSLGVTYLLANVLLVFADCVFFYFHYYVLIVIVGRIIHEFTAWPIYMAHDHNRHLNGAPNWLYRLTGDGWKAIVLSLGVTFMLGFALTFSASMVSVLGSVVVSLSIFHYYTEHFLWRKEGLLRQYVKFI